MQLMPETARLYDVVDPHEPRSNIQAGVKHLKWLLARFELPLALAAYNAGEAAVRRFGGLPPYPETRDYALRESSRCSEVKASLISGERRRTRARQLSTSTRARHLPAGGGPMPARSAPVGGGTIHARTRGLITRSTAS